VRSIANLSAKYACYTGIFSGVARGMFALGARQTVDINEKIALPHEGISTWSL